MFMFAAAVCVACLLLPSLPASAQGPIVSQGVEVIGADVWQAAGYDGTGVKVAIWDFGFHGYESLLGTELPPADRLTARGFGMPIEGPPEEHPEDAAHGTAVAEIVYDIAPGATFYLVATDSDQDAIDALEWLITEDVDVIAASGEKFFFADHISGAQRLENGNTIICSGTEGRFFEVTPAGETVWEYVNPFSATAPDGKTSNEVFRCESYDAEYIGAALVTASLTDGQTGVSLASPNVAVDEQPLSGAGPPATQGPPGIASISPTSLTAGSGEQLVTITLDSQYAPPTQVQFTRVAIGNIEATRWTRDGLIVRAWFEVPAQLHNGRYGLTITFSGRNGEPITFGFPIVVR